jgi:hypothetical protein
MEEMMSTKALLLELLLSGFFAVACFKARAGDVSYVALKPRDFLRLTDRLERLHRSRWQWFSMVLVVVLVRLQNGLPLVVELTAALQFLIFLALPTAKQDKAASRRDLLPRVVRKRKPRTRMITSPSGSGMS